MVDRTHILQEIRRTAAANGGVALGMQRFASQTGIRKSDWYGKYWARWGDALTEAGLAPNTLQEAYSEEFLISKLIDFIRELGRYPVEGELRLRARNDPQFPASTTLHRLGSKQERAAKLLAYAQTKGYADVSAICTSVV